MDRPLGAFVCFCVALVAAVSSWWGDSRLVDVAPHTHRADILYELAAHGGPALALVAFVLGVALVASEWKERRR